MASEDEDELLRAVALGNAATILKLRRQAEEELLAARDALQHRTSELEMSLAMMKATLDSATDGILVTDQRYRVTAFNQRFQEMWRLDGPTMEARDHRALVPLLARQFADPAGFASRVDAIYAEGPTTSFDLLALADGRVIERHSRPQVLQGSVVGRVWSYRDVSEQRRAEEALRDETRVLDILNRVGRDLASRLDLKAVVQAVTDAGTQISGARFGAFFYNVTDENGEALTLYTLSGAPAEAFDKFGHPRPTALFGPTFRGEPAIRSDDIRKDPRYGQWGPHHGMPPGHLPVCSYLAVPVISRSGEVIGGLFFGHPEPNVFTERSERILVGIAAQAAVAIDNARLYEAAQKAAHERAQLLESERAARSLAEHMSALKDDFVATLSHELRTPLSAILGWVHILRRSRKLPEDLPRGLDIIERNSRLQTQLIEDLLDMNRIASGRIRLEAQPIEAVSFVQAALETLRPAAQAKEIALLERVAARPCVVLADPARMQQVMTNLLSNAVKFTPPGGRIQLTVEDVQGAVEIRVEDTGSGIAPDFLAHVFERFRQADGSTSRKHGGLGLGLSIAKAIVELHGGTIRAHSDGLDQGATFTVRLPLAAAGAALAGKAGNSPAAAIEPAITSFPQGPLQDLSGLRLLVVDDSPDSRELACRILQDCHADVVVAADGQSALELARKVRPDLVITDIGMPEMDGFELLRHLQRAGTQQAPAIDAIALSAFARPEDRARALAAGFVAYLTKPVEAMELVAAVARATDRAGAAR